MKSTTPLVGRLTDANGLAYGANPFGQGQFQIVPAPGTTTLQNIAPGTYRIDVLDASGQVVTSQPVTINEGQPTEISL